MPWMEMEWMDQRVQFLAAQRAGEGTLSALARRFGVSRKTAYKWLRRYDEAGVAGLLIRSSRPHRFGRQLDASVQETIRTAQQAHPGYGPKKLRALLATDPAAAPVPAASTIGRLLQRERLSTPRQQRSPKPHATPTTLTAPTAPNHVWTVDFKGKHRTADGAWCYPLTVLDSASRYLLACIALPSTDGVTVRRHFEALFATYGLPAIIRSDNGTPFASAGLAGLTALNAWWCRLGIQLERIMPGHPEQNGRHERFHRTLKAAVPIAADWRAQQPLYDAFAIDYNTVRPHEALGQRPPATVYQPSSRPYRGVLPVPASGASTEVREVRQNGTVRFLGQELYLTTALIGETVGLVPAGGGHWVVLFAGLLLGWVDEPHLTLQGQPKQGERLSPPVWL